MKIPITFLGTGSAIPTARRNHISLLVQYKDEFILVDCGEGTQRQFRKAKLNPCSITRILITHWHGDHVLGLPGLLQTLALNGYNKTLHIYIPQGTRHHLDLMFKLFVFVGAIKYEVHESSSGLVFETPEFIVESSPMSHNTPTLAYSFKEKDKIRVDKAKLKKYKLKGKIIAELVKGKDIEFNSKTIKSKDLVYEQKGKKITFILDTLLNENMIKLAKDSDLLVSESTFLADSEHGDELAKENLHLTAKQAAQTASKSKSKQLALVHLSQRYEANPKPLLAEAKKIFKNTIIPEDLDKIEV
jgi:ribonuclease Z